MTLERAGSRRLVAALGLAFALPDPGAVANGFSALFGGAPRTAVLLLASDLRLLPLVTFALWVLIRPEVAASAIWLVVAQFAVSAVALLTVDPIGGSAAGIAISHAFGATWLGGIALHSLRPCWMQSSVSCFYRSRPFRRRTGMTA